MFGRLRGIRNSQKQQEQPVLDEAAKLTAAIKEELQRRRELVRSALDLIKPAEFLDRLNQEVLDGEGELYRGYRSFSDDIVRLTWDVRGHPLDGVSRSISVEFSDQHSRPPSYRAPTGISSYFQGTGIKINADYIDLLEIPINDLYKEFEALVEKAFILQSSRDLTIK